MEELIKAIEEYKHTLHNQSNNLINNIKAFNGGDPDGEVKLRIRKLMIESELINAQIALVDFGVKDMKNRSSKEEA